MKKERIKRFAATVFALLLIGNLPAFTLEEPAPAEPDPGLTVVVSSVAPAETGTEAPPAEDGFAVEAEAVSQSAETEAIAAAPEGESGDGTIAPEPEEQSAAVLPDGADAEAVEAVEMTEPPASGKSAAPDPVQTAALSAAPGFSVENVVLEADANPEFSRISFDMTDSSGREYTCLITGLRVSGEPSAAAMDELARGIAESFFKGAPYCLSDQSSEYFTPIDAEKYANYGSTPEKYGDSNLCWAGSLADMLEYTGWAEHGRDGNEDDILTELTECFYNQGSSQDLGIKYYFNGVNPMQKSNNNTKSDSYRDAAFPSPSQISSSDFAQQRDPGSEGGLVRNNGHHTSLAAEDYYEYRILEDGDIDTMCSDLTEAVEEGSAFGLGISFRSRSSGRVASGHALTVFGFIKEKLLEGAAALKAIFFSDPDNSIDHSDPAATSVDETYDARRGKENDLYMYTTDAMLLPDGTETMVISGYGGASYYTAFDDYTVLRQKNSGSGSGEETVGTADAVNTPDIVVNSMSCSCPETVNVGDTVIFSPEFQNVSYKAYDVADKPYVKCVLHLLDENGNSVKELPFEQNILSSGGIGGKANSIFYGYQSCSLDKPGTYTAALEITGVFSGVDGHPLREAYTGNNYFLSRSQIMVLGGTSGHGGDTCRVFDGPTYSAGYIISEADEPLEIVFDGVALKVQGLFHGGNRIAEQYYSISENADGTSAISFDAELFRILGTGHYLFELVTDDGCINFAVRVG